MNDARPTWAEIDVAAFRRNVEAVKRMLPDGSRLIAVLKANAYGHGAVDLARVCDTAMIATALLEESLALRRAGITTPLLVLGPLSEDAIRVAVEDDIVVGIVGPEELAAAADVSRDRDVRIHLKLDSGMNRMGLTTSDLADARECIRSAPRLKVEAIYTHFANASDPEDPFTRTQIDNFKTMLATLGIDAPLHHAANSAATARGLVTPGDYVRCGILLLGADPLDGPPSVPRGMSGSSVPRSASGSSAERTPEEPRNPDEPRNAEEPRNPRNTDEPRNTEDPRNAEEPRRLEPVLRWRTEIARLKTVPKGGGIGYGMTFHTTRDSRIATLPVGYADGYDRLLSNRGEVFVRGMRAPVVGRVSMDLVTIDVTDVPNVSLGDEVILLGKEIPAEEHAARTSTIAYEVFCRISARVPRVVRS